MRDAQKPDHINLSQLISRLREGRYVIPDFQREFEWKPSDIRDLLRSIFRDYYIGSLLLWKGNKENIRSLSCEPVYGYEGQGNPEHIVLDGQQRLTALYYAFLAPDHPLPTRANRYFYYVKVDKFMSEEFDTAFEYDWSTKVARMLGHPEQQYAEHNRIVLNWYPKIQAIKAAGLAGGDGDGLLHQTVLSPRHVAFLDVDHLYFELERFKAERGWYNLNLTRDGITELLADNTWYWLQIPEEELVGDSFEKVRVWQDIALALLKKYTERYYGFRKQAWELPHLEYRELETDDPNFLGVREDPEQSYYRVLYDKSRDDIAQKLHELKGVIESGTLKRWEFSGLKALAFGQHLYQPLLYLEGNDVEISPVTLNRGEFRFVEDLKAFHDANVSFFETRQLYLLRNMSRGRGVGFFEAGNFHPDFILWLLEGDKQRVVFVDPKGIHHLGKDDPKIRFHATIKEIEQRLGDQSVTLDSFIVSNTPAVTMEMQWSMDRAELRQRNIVFQQDASSYIDEILRAATTA